VADDYETAARLEPVDRAMSLVDFASRFFLRAALALERA
jgi:hypothetical protein